MIVEIPSGSTAKYEMDKSSTRLKIDSIDGKPRYMPLYPKERMSDQQLEDLKAYVLQKAS